LPGCAAGLRPEDKLRVNKDQKMPAEAKWKVVIADDHDFILNKVIEVVSDDFDVVATLNDGGRVAETVATLRPDAVILDISMPFVDGLSAARELKRLGLPTKVVFLTVGEDNDCMHVATGLGASYVLKRRMHIDLRIALHEALAGRVFVSPFLGVAVPVAR
jgi:DNA-binding NarL/FixJ family response regulator